MASTEGITRVSCGSGASRIPQPYPRTEAHSLTPVRLGFFDYVRSSGQTIANHTDSTIAEAGNNHDHHLNIVFTPLKNQHDQRQWRPVIMSERQDLGYYN